MTAPAEHVDPADGSASLQARLEGGRERFPDGGARDPAGLLRGLEADGRFRRDSGLGRVFHPGSVSLRENVPTDCVHIVIHHNRIAAHVDRVSPLHLEARSAPRYSVRRAVAHNLTGMAQDLGRLLRGRQGDHRAELACEWHDDRVSAVPEAKGLIDPSRSAWSLHLEARVGGRLDELWLRRAVGEVLSSRPADHDAVRAIECPEDADLVRARAELHAAPVRVTDWPPLRAWLAHHPEGDVVMLNVNHAACDGPAALRVLHSIARAYAGEAERDALPDFLAAGELPLKPAHRRLRSPRAQSALESVRDRLARPARFESDHPTDEPGDGFHLVCLSAADTGRVVDAGRPGRSRNVLLASLHLAIGEWNRGHGTAGHRISVLVQVNLRPPVWRAETIGNFSVSARVSTSRRHRASLAAALAAITAQTTRNKRTRTGIALVTGLDRSGLLEFWAKQSVIVLHPLTRNRDVDAAMLANLGVLPEAPSFGPAAGDTVGVWYSAPSRAPRSLSVGAVTVAGRLHLVFRYPHRVFGADVARRFAEDYVAQLLTMADSLSPPPDA